MVMADRSPPLLEITTTTGAVAHLSGRGYLVAGNPGAAACRPDPGLLQLGPVGAGRVTTIAEGRNYPYVGKCASGDR